MVELAAHYEIAVLLVTHDLDEASYLSDRVLILGGMPSRLQHELAVPSDPPPPPRPWLGGAGLPAWRSADGAVPVAL